MNDTTDNREQQFSSVADLARRFRVSESTIRRWAGEGKIEAYRFGRKLRFPLKAVENYIQESKVHRDSTE